MDQKVNSSKEFSSLRRETGGSEPNLLPGPHRWPHGVSR